MTFLLRQLTLLATAVQFLTRLPTPARLPFTPDAPVRAARWFPLVGHLVGALCAAVWLAAGRVWPAPVAALLAVAAGVAVTGAFHEDGLADTADAMGGATPERRLAIMKDSRIGTFGASALLLSLALRAAALSALPPALGAVALVTAHGAARAAAVVVMAATPYVGDVEGVKGRPAGGRPTPGEAAVAAVLGLTPLLLLPPAKMLVGVAAAATGVIALAALCRRTLGGHTGDVLGTAEQVVEVTLLLAAALSIR